MIQLPKPTIDVAAYIAEVVLERQNGKNAAFFSRIEQEWIARCEAYDTQSGDPVQLGTWPDALAKTGSFNNLYSSPAADAAQAPILATLRNRKLNFCPMCGEGGTPNTLDHYLPKQDFPHFAILPLNLVPACDISQGHKLARYTGPNGRLFIHPYYDAFLTGRVVELAIHAPFHAPLPELRCHGDVPEAYRTLVGRHLDELQLHQRFKSSFKTEYVRVVRLAKRMRKLGRDVPAVFEDLMEHAADRSLNSWEYVLFESVLNNPGFLDYLTAGRLPSNV